MQKDDLVEEPPTLISVRGGRSGQQIHGQALALSLPETARRCCVASHGGCTSQAEGDVAIA
ncbi:hypothetical protein [Jiangella endophytica]|uniref:hypothetical protein n=1 Tax=Jiangella endophytica TaxID=1623398 RepID=UPI0018E58B52|nr:hypothetical protein [Jiangella endophytica]